MAIPSRGIGWSTEDNLLWQISKQLEQLTNVTAQACTNCTTTTSTTTLPVYKVFTALLTQSGGDDFQTQSGGNTIIGVTYTIGNNGGPPGDWTNIGAPNNNVGTSFIATGTIPADWGDGFLDRNGGAPVATVLENTIGNIWFTYVDAGIYYINSSDLFTNNKTYTVIQLWGDDSITPRTGFVQRQSSSTLVLFNKDYTGEFSINGIGDVGYLTSIEIRVYN